MININETPKRLQEAYNFVRQFFPDWDKKRQWQIRYISGVYYIAKCNSDIKTIDIRLISDDDIELYVLLIHEICHTVSPAHSKKWQDSMKIAGKRIDQSGYPILAREIINEVNRYKGSSNVNGKFIYRKIAEIVIDNKNISFEDIMIFCSKEYYEGGMVPYKHCRKVYDTAIRHWERIDKIRNRLRGKKEEVLGY